MKKEDKKIKLFYIVVTTMLILYCFFCVQELKWKLLLLSQSGILLVRCVYEWLEACGRVNYARTIEKIYKVLSKILIVVYLIAMLGSMLGIWNL